MSAVFGFTTIIAILGMKDVPRIAIMTRTTANARTAAEIAEAFFCNLAHIPPGVELVYIFDDTERDRTFGMCLEETLRTHRFADRAKGAAAPALKTFYEPMPLGGEQMFGGKQRDAGHYRSWWSNFRHFLHIVSRQDLLHEREPHPCVAQRIGQGCPEPQRCRGGQGV